MEGSQTPLERVRAYVEAIPTLYDDDNPMPEGLCIDTATDWDKGVTHELLYSDLVALVNSTKQPEHVREHTHETGGAWHVTRWQVPGCPACAEGGEGR